MASFLIRYSPESKPSEWPVTEKTMQYNIIIDEERLDRIGFPLHPGCHTRPAQSIYFPISAIIGDAALVVYGCRLKIGDIMVEWVYQNSQRCKRRKGLYEEKTH